MIGSWPREVVSGSAEMRHRPGLLNALVAIDFGGAQVLVVAHSEALTRGARQMVGLVEGVDRPGAEVRSAVESSLTAEIGRFFFSRRWVGHTARTIPAEQMNERIRPLIRSPTRPSTNAA